MWKTIWQQPGKSNSCSSVVRLPCWIIKNVIVPEFSDLSSADIFILMRAQQAVLFCCRFPNNRHFSLIALIQCRNCGDAIDAKTHVSVSWSVATREIARHVDEITLVWADEYLRCIVSKFLWACSSQGFAPVMGRISSTFLHWSLFCSCWNSHPDTEVRWCPKKLWLLLLYAEMHMKFERTRLLKVGKRRFEIDQCRTLQSSQPEDATGILSSYETWYARTQTTW